MCQCLVSETDVSMCLNRNERKHPTEYSMKNDQGNYKSQCHRERSKQYCCSQSHIICNEKNRSIFVVSNGLNYDVVGERQPKLLYYFIIIMREWMKRDTWIRFYEHPEHLWIYRTAIHHKQRFTLSVLHLPIKMICDFRMNFNYSKCAQIPSAQTKSLSNWKIATWIAFIDRLHQLSYFACWCYWLRCQCVCNSFIAVGRLQFVMLTIYENCWFAAIFATTVVGTCTWCVVFKEITEKIEEGLCMKWQK